MQTKIEPAAVLIVGAGPSGLVLALLLCRHGISVRIIDKAPIFMVGQRGAGIMPRTQELYKILGILPQVEKDSCIVLPIRMYPSPEVEGQPPFSENDLMEHFDEKPEYHRINAFMLGQEDHQTILRDILSKEYECHVELSTELVSFTTHPDHVVAQIQKSESSIEEIRFDWVIGTDGAHSVVRKKLGLTFLGETMDANSLAIGDIEVLQGFDSSFWTIWGSPADKMLASRPYSRQNKNYHWFMIGGKNIDVVKAASDREVLLNYIHETIGKKKFEYGELRTAGPWRANIRMVNKFGEGRVFVAGDAAHVHSPTGAQGLNSGVQDSVSVTPFCVFSYHEVIV
uniref:FAD-binding domain-containing protein n=1 Tax=Moniliophthora roreri TaxID=221103 RepID=A0A0W0FJC3_MONRR